MEDWQKKLEETFGSEESKGKWVKLVDGVEFAGVFLSDKPLQEKIIKDQESGMDKKVRYIEFWFEVDGDNRLYEASRKASESLYATGMEPGDTVGLKRKKDQNGYTVFDARIIEKHVAKKPSDEIDVDDIEIP